MGWLSVFSPKSADEVIKNGMKAIDAVFFTDEEKAVHQAKVFDAWIRAQEAINSETTPRSINRRYVAWSIVLMISTFATSTMIMAMYGFDDKARTLIEVAEAYNLGFAFVSVIMFYFGTHALSLLGGKKKK